MNGIFRGIINKKNKNRMEKLLAPKRETDDICDL